jgi:hypothetical protein
LWSSLRPGLPPAAKERLTVSSAVARGPATLPGRRPATAPRRAGTAAAGPGATRTVQGRSLPRRGRPAGSRDGRPSQSIPLPKYWPRFFALVGHSDPRWAPYGISPTTSTAEAGIRSCRGECRCAPEGAWRRWADTARIAGGLRMG